MNTSAVDRLNAALAERYAIEGELGEGGMATVYLAHDVRHDRKVALKVLKPELAAVIGAERFLAEIKTTANLQHPHILPLHDSGRVDGTVFYVMPHVDGESLRDRLGRERQLPIDDALRIAREVAAGLDFAHRKGIVHRDIKPANILLLDDQALVADFGIALAANSAGGSRLTETGMSLGTPTYMSPEQAMGDESLDNRADVYSLGCVLYEMLTGEPPFSGTSAQAILGKVLTGEPTSPTELRRTVPAHVEAALLVALEKLPADRFATAADFASALEGKAALSGSRRSTGTVQGRRDWRVALVVGVLLGAVATSLIPRAVAPPAPPDTTAGRVQLTFNGRSMDPAISPQGDVVAYVDRTCEHVHDVCRATLLVQEMGSTQAVPIMTAALEIQSPRWTHDGASLVVAARLDSLRSGLFAIPWLGGVPRRVGPWGLFDTNARGDTMVAVSQAAREPPVALFVDLATGSVTDRVTLPTRGVTGVGWSPNGRFLAVTTWQPQVVIVGRDGALVDSTSVVARAPIRWSPEGDVLTFRMGAVKEDDLIRLRVGPEGRFSRPPEVVLGRIPTFYSGVFDVARREPRAVLVTGNPIQDIWTFQVGGATAAGQQRTRGTTYYSNPVVSPDGSTVYYQRGDALGDNLYALSLGDGLEEALTAEPLPGALAIQISVDGRRIVYGHTTDAGMRMSVLDLASRTAVHAPVRGGATFLVTPIRDRSFLSQEIDGSGLLVLDSLGGQWKRIPAPDSMVIQLFSAGPDGTSAAVLVETEREMIIGTVPLDRWDLRVLHRENREQLSRRLSDPFPWPSVSLSWTPRGSIHLARWLREDDAPSLWRVSREGGELTRVGGIPPVCFPDLFLHVGDSVGVCQAQDYRYDVWVAELPGGQ